MRRNVRRGIAVAVGLVLGWSAAGLAPAFFGGSVSLAEEAHPASATEGHASGDGHHHVAGESHDEHAAAGGDHGHAGDHGDHGDTGIIAAQQLVPSQRDVPWLGGVLAAVVLLFIAAVVLGIPALRLRGPLPPDPAEALAHDEGHHAEDHGGGAHTQDPHGGHPEPVTSVRQSHAHH